VGVFQKRLEWAIVLKSGGVAWITSLLKHQYADAKPSTSTRLPRGGVHAHWSPLSKPESPAAQQPLLPRRGCLEGRDGARGGEWQEGRGGGRGNTLYSKIGMQYKDGAGISRACWWTPRWTSR